MVTGWKQVSGKWYYFDGSGVMQTGWTKVGSTWYYFYSNGSMVTGWCEYNSKWYYFGNSGAMQTGWLKHGGNWYYLSSSGAMLTGTHKIGNATYQFDGNGKLVRTVTAAAQPAPASNRYAHVLDVSQWQGKIDFNKVKASGVSAVIIRCGYGKYKAGGSMNTDSYFYQNIKNTKAAGLAVGVYYFSYAYTRQQAINEANHCLRIIKGYGLNLPVYFDWEYDSMTKAKKFMGSKAFKKVNWRSNITDMTAAFCDTITKGGYRAGYYFNLQYLNN
jgi:GH25 family lysozyme M1 (1,4-beta-N-acetylmuramidase)